MPKVKKPQNYKLSIRVGSKSTLLSYYIRNRISKLNWKKGTNNPGHVKIEYIDYLVARNFLDVIKNWFESTEKTTPSKFTLFLRSKIGFICFCAKYFLFFISLLITQLIIPVYISSKEENLSSFTYLLLYCFVLIFTSLKFGEFISRKIFWNINSIIDISYIKLNRGDERVIEEIEKENRNELINSIINTFITIILGIFSSVIAYYITK